MDNSKALPSVYRTTLETYYNRTYGDQLAIRVASIALVAGVTVFIGVWPLAWAAAWAVGYLVGEVAILAWWRRAQRALKSSAPQTFGRLQSQLIMLSAFVSSYGAIPCFVTLAGDQAALLLGVLLAVGILLTIAAQHSLHRHMFLATAPVAAVALGGWVTAWILVQQGPNAAIAGKEVPARFGPLEESDIAVNFADGTEVRVEQYRNGWVRVSDAEGRGGWIPGLQVARYHPRIP